MLADYFSILLDLTKISGIHRLVRSHLVKRHLHAPLTSTIFQYNLKWPQETPVANRAEVLILNGRFHRTGFREPIFPNDIQRLPFEPQSPA